MNSDTYIIKVQSSVAAGVTTYHWHVTVERKQEMPPFGVTARTVAKGEAPHITGALGSANDWLYHMFGR